MIKQSIDFMKELRYRFAYCATALQVMINFMNTNNNIPNSIIVWITV